MPKAPIERFAIWQFYSIMAIAISVLATGCRPPLDAYSQVHSDSGIYGPAYEQIVTSMENLAAGSNGFATVMNFGTTAEGRTMAMIKLGAADSSLAKRPAVVITGAIHGDEFLDIAHKLPDHFWSQRESGAVGAFFRAGGIIYVAPILNPDGYDRRQRGNSSGADLNRDFPLKKQNHQGLTNSETNSFAKALREEVDSRNVNLSFTLDYHCCQGSLIYPWGFSQSERLPAKEETEYKRFASLMLKEFEGYKSGRVFDLLQYTALGGSTDYYHESFGARAFTFEGAFKKEAQQFDRHTRMWDSILTEVNRDNDSVTAANDQLAGSAELFIDLSKLRGIDGDLGVASTRLDTTRVLMCKADAKACATTSEGKMIEFSHGAKIEDVMVFRSSLSHALEENTIYSFVAFGMDDKPSVLRSFRLQRP